MKETERGVKLEGQLGFGEEDELAAEHLLPANEIHLGLETQQTRWLLYIVAASLMWTVGSNSKISESKGCDPLGNDAEDSESFKERRPE